MHHEHSALAGLKWTATTRFAGQLATWVVTLVVIRVLAPEDYGLMAISAVIVGLSASIAEFGLGSSLVQAPALASRELARVAGLAIVSNAGIALLVVLAAPLAGRLYASTDLTSVIQVSALQCVLAALGAVPQALATRQMRFKWLGTLDLAAGLVASATTLLLALQGAGVWSLVVGNLAGGTLRTIVLVRDSWVAPSFEFGGTKRHLSFGGTLTAARLVWQFVNQSDVLIAGRFLSQEAVGVYSVSLHLATLPMQKLMGVINQVAFPTVARMQDDLVRLGERLLFALRLLNLVAVGALWGLSAVAPEFVLLLFGPKWGGAVLPLQVAALVVPLRMSSAILSTAVLGVGAATLDLRNMLINLVVLPVAFVVGVAWGVEGLAVGGALGITVVMTLTVPRMCRVLGLDVIAVLRTARAPILAGLALYVAVIAARALWPDPVLLVRFAVLILAGAAAYVATVTLIDRTVWRDAGRLVAALKG